MMTAETELNEVRGGAEPDIVSDPRALPALSPRARRAVRISALIGLIAVLVTVIGLAGAWASRAYAPTRRGWTCFPVSRGGLMCQNIVSWYHGRSYGRTECVEALVAAAGHLRGRMPGAKVAYMDASDANGGRFLKHRSHRDGVDVDVQYIGRTGIGEPYPASPAIFASGYRRKYDRSGHAEDITFDPGANWLFLEGLHEQKALRVEAIFVEPYIREWLLRAGKEMNAPRELRQWASSVLTYAGAGAGDHKDHFHVRFEN